VQVELFEAQQVRMVSILMVAEKPSICTAIADALYAMNRSCNKEPLFNKGRSPPVYEFSGMFFGQLANFRITSVTGHVFSLDFPSKYQNWDQIDPLELFTAPTSHTSDKGGIVKHLEREARGIDKLVLWMDCDREGENICFEVIRTIQHIMNKPHGNQQVYYRAKFSAVTVKDIEKAMKNLVEPNENESKSVDARQELDLKIGVSFSRFQTRYFQNKYGNLDSSIISYGPCQTPTLGFCVTRHDEIQSFIPEPFWTIDLSVEVPIPGLPNPRKLSLNWQRGRLFDQNITEMFLSMIQSSASTTITCYDVKTKETRKTRPQPLNTVELLKFASKHLGIGPHSTMRAAEHLYLSGYISYPRTESTQYPKSFDIRDAIMTIKDYPDYASHCRALLSEGYIQPRSGHDAGDHPPITPVGIPASSMDISGENGRIYDLIVSHFLATISKDAVYLKTKAKFRTSALVAGNNKSAEEFTVVGKRLIQPGFLALYGPNSKDHETGDDDDYREEGEEGGGGHGEDEEEFSGGIMDLPELSVGKAYSIGGMNLREGKTSAPGYLTESELISLMEKNGIGTDASIPTHINNILTRNYVTLGQQRTLVPTNLGIVLVHGYLRIDPDLVLPDVRAAIENFCGLIAKGSASKEAVRLFYF
jgi:DNA topoisomerase-3